MFLFHDAYVENEDTLISYTLLTVVSIYFNGVLFAPKRYINQRDLKIRGDLIAGSVDLQCRKEP
jgi:hypothetical protein